MLTPNEPTVLGDDARYRVERRLGAGAFGVVYAARDRRHDVPVAIKLLSGVAGSARAQLERELQLLSGVEHRNVVRLHELGEDDGDVFLVMERVEGVDFVRYVRADLELGPGSQRPPRRLPMVFGQEPSEAESSSFIPPSEAGLKRLQLALPQVFAGLGALHARGVVHRDVRPANVRVTPGGRVVLLDFGLSATTEEGGEAVGSPAYMAPEQFNDADAGPESDWYSVGVLIFEALTGSLPFVGGGQEVFVRKRTVSAPRLSLVLPDAPRALDELCAALLEAEPQRRRERAAPLLERL